MRLLLRSGANPGMENNNGKTPLSIAKERGHELCEEMVCDTWDNFSYNRRLKHYELIIDSLIHHTLQYFTVIARSSTKENYV